MRKENNIDQWPSEDLPYISALQKSMRKENNIDQWPLEDLPYVSKFLKGEDALDAKAEGTF